MSRRAAALACLLGLACSTAADGTLDSRASAGDPEIDRDPSVKGALLFTFDETDYWSGSNLIGEQARLAEVIDVCDP